MTDLTQIQKVAEAYNNDVLALKRARKNVQSRKCLWAKKKGLKDYEKTMTEILAEERSLTEAILMLEPKEKFVTNFTADDINKLDFNQTEAALNSIRSKKARSGWLTTEYGQNDDFKNAERIEQMLLAHKSTIKPVEDGLLRKSQLEAVIDAIETTRPELDRVVEMLRNLLK